MHFAHVQTRHAERGGGFAIPNLRFSEDGSSLEVAKDDVIWVRSLRTRRGHRFRLHVVGALEGDQAADALYESLADSLRAQLERLESIG